jgi:hypothetical protein
MKEIVPVNLLKSGIRKMYKMHTRTYCCIDDFHIGLLTDCLICLLSEGDRTRATHPQELSVLPGEARVLIQLKDCVQLSLPL